MDNYKNYSLERLNEWVNDAISCSGASPQEIYNTIKKAVEENYYIHKHQTSQCYELLALLNGNGIGHIEAYDDCVDKILSCDKDDPSPECKNAWTSFWEENYYSKLNNSSNMSNIQYTEDELNAMCDKALSDEKKKLDKEIEEIRKEGGYEWTPEPLHKMTYSEAISSGWKMTDDGFWIFESEDKISKWILPVETDSSSGEYYVILPGDLLKAANLEEGDQVEYVDNGDGSYTVRKVNEHD